MRFVFVTNSAIEERGGAPYSDLASVRREIILPALALRERGIDARIVSLPGTPAEQADALARGADRVVFGKILRKLGEGAHEQYSEDARAYEGLLKRTGCLARSLFCFADDHFDAPSFSAFYKGLPQRARGWVASSQALKERLERETSCPVRAYAEPAETPPGEPRVPQHGLRSRVGLALARRAGVGLEPWRLRLLWFGHPSNVPSLLPTIHELRAVAAQVPLHLECVTVDHTPLDGLAGKRGAGTHEDLLLTVTPWSQQALWRAMERCDAVLLPQAADDPQKRLKSNNRLVDTIHAGRFALCNPLPSYRELEAFAWIGDSIGKGLVWLLKHPRQALQRIRDGQQYVALHHSRDALAAFWQRA